MERLLWLKMVRDMKKMKTTYLLCLVIVSIGFCGYSVLELCYENLAQSRDLFFVQAEFCDGFAQVSEAPFSMGENLARISGIDKVDARLVQDVRVRQIEPLGGLKTDVTSQEIELHMVSWDSGQMNRPVLSRGAFPGAGRRELVIGESIAKARDLSPGDKLYLLVGGKTVMMEISGIGMTPENIYMIKDMNELFPSPATYDAAFTSRQTMEGILGQSGTANSFLFRLEPGADWDQVKDEAEQMLTPYGLSSHYEKDDQIGVSMVGEEIKQLEQMAGVVPVLFLMVAVVILYISLSRLVEQQRTQIGTLMALGIPIGRIQLHYLSYGGVIGLAGGFAGSLLGYFAADPMADYYRVYFSLPDATAPLSFRYLFFGTAVAALFCGGCGWLVAGRMGQLNPAEALRPEAPKKARRSILEKLPGFSLMFTVPGMMAVRSLSRNRRRTAFSVGGMAFAYMITATLVSMNAMFDLFIFDYWEKTQRQDMMISFARPVAAGDALEAARHPLVEVAEGQLEFPVTLYGPKGKTDCSVVAIAPDAVLCRLFRADGTRVYVQPEGIVISEHMAKLMSVKRGDIIRVRVSYPKEQEKNVMVSDVIAQYMGSSAYMSHAGAAQISEYRDVCTSVLLKAPAHVLEDITGRLNDASQVTSVQSRAARVEQYRSMMGSMSAIMGAMSMLGVLISFVVVYISSLIRYEEMKRELTTLMVLGLKSGECLEVISIGQWLLAVAAVILGIPLAMGASRWISVAMASDVYTIPSFIDGNALLLAAGLTAVSVGLSGAAMLRKLKKIVPVDLLRERE